MERDLRDRWRGLIADLALGHPAVLVAAAFHASGPLGDCQREDGHALLLAARDGLGLRFPGGEVACPPGVLAVVPAGLPHRVDDPRRAGGFLHLIAGSDGLLRVVHGYRSDGRGLAARFVGPGPRLMAACLESAVAVHRMADAWDPITVSERLQEPLRLALQALATILEEEPESADRGDPLAILAQRYLQEHFTDPACSIEAMALELGRHPDTLARQCRDHLGRAPQQILRELRIARARELLIHADLDVQAVAGACGFRDRRYFTRVFREATGHSPREYRRLASLTRLWRRPEGG